MRGEQVHHGQIHLTKTKTSKNRSIPISKELIASLPKKSGRLFSVSLNAFRRAIERTGIELPKGQMTHVMRHSFASHFMMNGANLLTLNKILGHQTIQMTMRYAHLAPDHLLDAVKYNPINCGGQKVDSF